jgi:DNA-binding transcriptional MerR regulator
MTDDDKIHYLPRLHISQATRLFGMTARAVRFYEERGLIEVGRDAMNRRCYDQTARRRLGWIRDLRGAGLSLRDIQDVIDADEDRGAGDAVALERLRARRATIERELLDIDGVIGRLAGSAADDVAAPASARAG